MMQARFDASLRAIGGFESPPRIAVAVSGGPDSTALALLAHAWTQERGGHVIALTVDHGLRIESADEARQIHGWMEARGIPHHVLAWQGDKPASNIQEAAREARYRLMEAFCREHNIPHLLTGHQRDDQTESFWLRLARGSGALGLACMPAVHYLKHARVVRPLLGMEKNALQAWLQEQGQGWIEDPSNQSDRYNRSKLRKLQPWLAEQGFTAARLAATIESLGDAREILEQHRAQAAVHSIRYHPGGFATLHMPAWEGLNRSVAVQLLMRLAMVIGGQDTPPRYEDAARLHARMRQQESSTLHGMQATWHESAGTWLFLREASRQQGAVAIGEGVVWDGRVEARPVTPEHRHWQIGPATTEAIKHARESKDWQRHPWRAYGNAVLASLPCVIDLEGRQLLPHISTHGITSEFALLPVLRPYAAQPLCNGPFVSHHTLMESASYEPAGS
ncbi:tRNA lysidine(34) synthetase TilS [bacterium]|nr:tRNA lysidine(34) synthetase TilS [bacterium]